MSVLDRDTAYNWPAGLPGEPGGPDDYSGQPKNGEERPLWLISFADVLAIILCFLILIFAYNIRNDAERDDLVETLKNRFDKVERTGARLPIATGKSAAEDGYTLALLAYNLKNRTGFGHRLLTMKGKTYVSWPLDRTAGPQYKNFLANMARALMSLDVDSEVVVSMDPSLLNGHDWNIYLDVARDFVSDLRASGYDRSISIHLVPATGKFTPAIAVGVAAEGGAR